MPKLVWITEPNGDVVAEVDVYERKNPRGYDDRFGLNGTQLHRGHTAALAREEQDRQKAEAGRP